jgi:hypothetical protein
LAIPMPIVVCAGSPVALRVDLESAYPKQRPRIRSDDERRACVRGDGQRRTVYVFSPLKLALAAR